LIDEGDAPGDWYQLWEDSGEFARLRYGRLVPGALQPSWVLVPRALHDGPGGLARLLRDAGVAVRDLPRLDPQRRPDALTTLAAFERLFQRPTVVPARWLAYDVAWRPLLAQVARPRAGAWHLFSRHETAALEQRATADGAPVDSMLLAALARAVTPWLAGDGPMVWELPVNLRGAVARSRDVADHSSAIALVVDPDSPPSAFHAAREERLRDDEHWASWHHLHLGATVGPAGLRGLQRVWAEHGLRTGVFADLGAWPLGETIPDGAGDGDGGWLHAPMVTRFCPFGAGAVTFRGRLGLTVQAHPALSTSPAEAQGWLDAWRDELLEST
jgi:hypothetical protein